MWAARKLAIKADTVSFPRTEMHVKLHKQINVAHYQGWGGGRHNKIQLSFGISLAARQHHDTGPS
jgi:hypothetical protein